MSPVAESPSFSGLNSIPLCVWTTFHISIRVFMDPWVAPTLGPLCFAQSESVSSHSRVRLFATPWTVARQAPPSMGFPRQTYRSRLPFPSPGDFPDPGIEPRSPALQADSLRSEPPGFAQGHRNTCLCPCVHFCC